MNASGLNIDWGDIVVQDTAGDDRFTTNNVLNYFGGWVGVAQAYIGSNTTGPVLLSGYTPVINVGSNTTTRGQFLYGSNTVRRAYGATSRTAGAFGQALSTGVAPDAIIWPTTDSPGTQNIQKTLTNKSGGTVNKGDVVVVDETTNESFTTNATFDVETSLGIVQDASIANNAAGVVALVGYVDLTNTASIAQNRGDYVYASSNAKIVHGSNTRNPGAFGQFLQAGSNSSAWIWGAGDQTATGGSGGTDLAGKELDYVEFTSPVVITATTEATANTVVTGSAVAYDGVVKVLVEFYSPWVNVPDGGAGRSYSIILYDSVAAASIGIIAFGRTPATGFIQSGPVYAAHRLTPSNATHTYSIRAFVSNASNGQVSAGVGGAGAYMPGFIRITRV